LIAITQNHIPTQQIVLANSDFKTVAFPQKMVGALKSLVSDQRQQNFNDPNLSIIWGQILFDQKPTSGVQINVENHDYLEPIYFNSLMLPDPSLKSTSENGYFAFLGAPDDFHHLVARRNEIYFGHVNTKVTEGMVSYVTIENSIKSEEIELKVYDAFSGAAQAAELSIQSLPEKIQVQQGQEKIFLPSVGRFSLLHALPSEETYQPAYYSYVDRTDYIYVPLVSREWLYQLITQQKLNVSSQSGLVIGFVHDEDFLVEVRGPTDAQSTITYFDYAGRATKAKQGTQGGGFLITGLAQDTYEIIVHGSKSQKTYSRIAPLKAQDTFIFSFKADN
jgi:hypothetical protein